ncbi:MAG TPA: LpqB family beta-propeller domain-containing protein, partial [Terrimesophilobacter sp.]|nr:LpqB family beta-propeller domain-containing protein [Terrimesophilobacter sp.]
MDRTRSRVRASRATLIALGVSLLVSSCVGIPSTGSVEAGPEFGELTEADTIFNPLGPQPGAEPLGILEGFIDAFTGTQSDYAVARQFLSTSFQAEWDPRHSVAIRSGSETFRAVDSDTLEYSFMTRAGLDEHGSYTANPLETQLLSYSFVQENGEWRISEAPPGIVLAESTFRTIFSQHSLYFYDLALVRLVPDQRWFPGGATATRIVSALLEGVPPWLEGAVVSQFPEGSALTQGTAVTVESSVARVDLTAEAASASPRQRQLMKLQLSESLASVSSVASVELSVSGTSLAIEPLGTDSPTVDSRVDARPLVLKDGEFGYATGEELTPITALSDKVVDLEANAATLGVLGNSAAVRAGDGTVWTVRGGQIPARLVDSRPNLIAPSLDDYGYTWSIPSTDPNGLLVFDFEGNSYPVATGFAESAAVVSIDVSRDGTRIAVLLQGVEGPRLIVSAVLRDSAQGYVPTALGPAILDVLLEPGQAIDATWVDESSVATLEVNDDVFSTMMYDLGGFALNLGRAEPAVSIVGGNGRTGIRVLGEDGSVS